MAGRNRRGRLDLSTRFVLPSLRLREGVARFYPLLFNTCFVLRNVVLIRENVD